MKNLKTKAELLFLNTKNLFKTKIESVCSNAKEPGIETIEWIGIAIIALIVIFFIRNKLVDMAGNATNALSDNINTLFTPSNTPIDPTI